MERICWTICGRSSKMMIHHRKHPIHWMNRHRWNHQKVRLAHHPAIPGGMMNRRRASHQVDDYGRENVQIQIPVKMATNHRQKRSLCERSVCVYFIITVNTGFCELRNKKKLFFSHRCLWKGHWPAKFRKHLLYEFSATIVKQHRRVQFVF